MLLYLFAMHLKWADIQFKNIVKLVLKIEKIQTLEWLSGDKETRTVNLHAHAAN